MRRLMLAAVSVAVLVVALGAWSSDTGAGAAVAVAVHHSALRLPPARLAPPPSGWTTCAVGASACSLTPCVQLVGSVGVQPAVIAQLRSRSRLALPKALLRALSQLGSRPPAVRRALSPERSPCRRVGHAPEPVTDMLLEPAVTR